MVRAIKLMEVYADIPGMVETMRMNETRTEKEADLIVTTAHTSKERNLTMSSSMTTSHPL